MRVLALESSTEWLSVAVGDGAHWHEHVERTGNANSERLLPAVERLLADAGWRLADLDGIAFGAGPGAFTGVRIACGVAQGLAFGADLPCAPVPTLAALAQAAWRARQWTRVCACLDARMHEVYLAAYVRDADGWTVASEPLVRKPAEVAALPDGDWYGAGDGFAAYPALAVELALVDADAAAYPTARAVGELGIAAFARGAGVAAADAHPLYVRHRVALTTAERAAGLRL